MLIVYFVLFYFFNYFLFLFIIVCVCVCVVFFWLVIYLLLFLKFEGTRKLCPITTPVWHIVINRWIIKQMNKKIHE